MPINGIPTELTQATISCKANIYFEGRVISHSVTLADGSRCTLGLIYPGRYTFSTAAPERMTFLVGGCSYRLEGQQQWQNCSAGEWFDVPGNSAFDLAVDEGIAEYLCSFG